MEEKKIFINGLKINYKIAGEGQLILILHGWGGSSDSWVEVIKILSNQGYKIICPDLPGFGKTQKPNYSWELGDYRNFVKKFIENLNLEKFYLLGHSFGGAIAVKFSSIFPEKTEK
ncbi:MAG: alpha/beta hydrolase, partial [Patescibacteria group bacterium]|nr:alpha/beta hydrolase [Patescibacteria group bacterium]